MGFLRVTPIDPGQQIALLRRRDRYRFTGNRWPHELSSLESFCEQAGCLAIVPDRLYKIAAATAEDEQMIAERSLCSTSCTWSASDGKPLRISV